MDQSIERLENTQEKADALKTIIELAKNAGLTDVQLTAERELELINPPVREKIIESSSEQIFEENTQQKKEKIENSEEVNQQVQQLKDEIMQKFQVENNTEPLESKSLPEFGPFTTFSQSVSDFKEGKISTSPGRQRFTYNPTSGELLPSREGLELASLGAFSRLQETFDFTPKIDFDLPIEQLEFRPAIIGTDGAVIQKGEIRKLDSATITSGTEEVVPIRNVEVQKERSIEGVQYQEYSKQFTYFDKGEGTSFETSDDSRSNIYSYNPQTGEVLPRKEGWEYAKSNPSFLVHKYFDHSLFGEKWNIPLDELRFIPAKVNSNGVLIQKGRIIAP